MAVPAAAIVIGTGALPLQDARAEALRLAPVLGFLGAILVLGQLCESEGLFTAAGARLGRLSRHNPVRLLSGTFGLASATTAVLSLDTTIVLLTPVVHETATTLRLRAKPHVYACTHLANSSSLLLPVSNLTNLLAYSVIGLTLVGFTETMALSWGVAIAVEYAAFRLFFSADLAAAPMPETGEVPATENTPGLPAGEAADVPATEDAAGFPAAETATADTAGEHAGPAAASSAARGDAGVPAFPLAVVAATLAGFAVTSFTGVYPVWAAFGGACVLAARALARRETSPVKLLRAVSFPFLLFVLSLGLVVRALDANGLGGKIARLLPHGSSLPALLITAGIAAVFANLVNNLPAVLVLLAAITSAGAAGAGAFTLTGPVLAILIGVNIGPNLTYAGSLATLLWRRLLSEREHEIDLGEFTRLGLLTVPAGIALATVALWISLRLTGHG